MKKKKRTHRNIIVLLAGILTLSFILAPVPETFAFQDTAEASEQETAASPGMSQSTSNQTVVPVYHRHLGSAQTGLGCYGNEIRHAHTGTETGEGGCYTLPIYHEHTGSSLTGGGCYGLPIYHEHTGNAGEEGGCYTKAVRHEAHTDDCYSYTSSTELGCTVLSTEETDEYDENGNRLYYFYMSCKYVVNKPTPEHLHRELKCVGIGNAEAYDLDCGKTEETVESYGLNCEKDENTIEYYTVSCNKTEETVDGYSLNCGRDETTAYGQMILTEEQTDDLETARITAVFEDFTGGVLRTAEHPFLWYDMEGNVLGNENELLVFENGNYRATLQLLNEDVDRDRLTGTIAVDSIGAADAGTSASPSTVPEETASPSAAPEETAEASALPEETASPAIAPEETPEPSTVPSKTPVNREEDNDGGDGDGGEEVSQWAGTVPAYSPAAEDFSEVLLPPVYRKTENVQAKEVLSDNQEIPEIQVTEPEKTGLQKLMESPVVRIVSITAGTLLALAGIFLLIWLLLMTARIYNDNGEGKMRYLGREMLVLGIDGYYLTITDELAEKAVTNRYCIKPPYLFRLIKGKDGDLVIQRGNHYVLVPLQKEIIITFRNDIS